MMDISPERLERFKKVISNRQYDLTLVLENVHDPHNIGAVLRTCDSVGINEIYLIYTDPRLQERGVKIGQTSSSGAKQWIQVNYFENIAECFNKVKSKYKSTWGTKLDTQSVGLYKLNLIDSCALVFGNEHKGLSDEACTFLDGNFVIPQQGFTKSLNISVACAVSLYEAQRQRLNAGMYDRGFGSSKLDQPLYDKFVKIHMEKKLPHHLRGKGIV